MKYYVINLKRRQDRLESFKQNCPLNTSQIKRFDAIDGKCLDTKPNYFKNLNPGEIGCFLSHKILWEKIVRDDDCNYCVIFEDDAKFPDNFQESFNDIINKNIDFNILYIGGRCTENFKMKTCVKVTDKIVKYDYNKNWVPSDCDRGTYSYIISKNCCKFLLEHFDKIVEDKGIFPPIDHYIMMTLRENKKDIHHSYPLLCWSDVNSPDSDIQLIR